jgi:hypothetical protein
MAKTTRRNVLKAAGGAGIAATVGMLIKAETGTPVKEVLAAEDHGHGEKPITGPLANATVTFGGWQSGPAPFDRFGTDPNDRTRNHHHLTPNVAKIEEGGTVNFIIGGFHNVLIYDHGVQPQDIDRTDLVPGSAPPLINDSTKRIYRGLDPRTLTTQDRVETVQFATAGVYLVICGVLPHFFNATTMQFEMFGYVRVVKKGHKDWFGQ